MTKDMTSKKFFEAVANGEQSEELQEFALAQIEKIEKQNAKKREQLAKKREENDPLKTLILENVGESQIIKASEVAKIIDKSTQKASAVVRMMVEDGTMVEVEPDKRTKQYKRVVEVEELEE